MVNANIQFIKFQEDSVLVSVDCPICYSDEIFTIYNSALHPKGPVVTICKRTKREYIIDIWK